MIPNIKTHLKHLRKKLEVSAKRNKLVVLKEIATTLKSKNLELIPVKVKQDNLILKEDFKAVETLEDTDSFFDYLDEKLIVFTNSDNSLSVITRNFINTEVKKRVAIDCYGILFNRLEDAKDEIRASVIVNIAPSNRMDACIIDYKFSEDEGAIVPTDGVEDGTVLSEFDRIVRKFFNVLNEYRLEFPDDNEFIGLEEFFKKRVMKMIEHNETQNKEVDLAETFSLFGS